MPVTEQYAYFDHAAVAPLPKPAYQAIQDYAQEAHLHGDAVWPRWSGKVRSLRSSCAQMLGVDNDEIALVNSTTQGINLVAEGIPWRVGDNVLVPENEFPSNMLAWRNLERRGVEVRAVKVLPMGAVTADVFRDALDDRTRLIAFSWVGYSSGYRADIAAIVDLAHGNSGQAGKTLVLLDAIQGLGAFPLDVRAVGVDFVCADGHKWMLGPEGAGLFYLKKEHLEFLQPIGLGWNSLAESGFEPLGVLNLADALKSSAERYEGGTTNMAGMHGFGASLEFLRESGLNSQPSSVRASILNNVGLIEQNLSAAGFELHLPAEPHRSGIVGVSWAEADQEPSLLSDARRALLQDKVVTSVRGGRLRISTHAYNDEQDVQRLVDGLVRFRASL